MAVHIFEAISLDLFGTSKSAQCIGLDSGLKNKKKYPFFFGILKKLTSNPDAHRHVPNAPNIFQSKVSVYEACWTNSG